MISNNDNINNDNNDNYRTAHAPLRGSVSAATVTALAAAATMPMTCR